MSNFESLCKALNLPEQNASSQQLAQLQQWCEEHIKAEMNDHGTDAERYQQYLALARDYLDNFIAFLPQDMAEAVPAFDGMTGIQYAALRGYDKFLALLDASYLDAVNQQTPFGMTALHFAALNGHFQAVKNLVAAGARADISNQNGQYPIHSALELPIQKDERSIPTKVAIFEYLKNQAPSVLTSVDSSGDTIAHLMAVNGFNNLINDLIKDNKDLLFVNNNHSRYPIHTAILNNQLDVVRTLIKVPEMALVKDAEKRTALHYAAKYGNADMVLACCEGGGINALDTANKTPLITAAEAGNLPAVQALISQGANITLTDYQGFNILHYAVQIQNSSLVNWILENTPLDINALDVAGRSPLFYAQHPSRYPVDKTIETALLRKGGQDKSASTTH